MCRHLFRHSFAIKAEPKAKQLGFEAINVEISASQYSFQRGRQAPSEEKDPFHSSSAL